MSLCVEERFYIRAHYLDGTQFLRNCLLSPLRKPRAAAAQLAFWASLEFPCFQAFFSTTSSRPSPAKK